MPQRADIVQKAGSFVGYLNGQGYDQANQFSSYLGFPHEAWCADFVTAVYAMAGLPLPSMSIGHHTGYSYVPDSFAYGKSHHAVRNSWEAQPGDIICFDWTGAGTCTTSKSHTGLVDHWSSGVLHTIEGNSGPHGGVNRRDWPAPAGSGNADIAGVIDTSRLVSFSDDTPVIPVPVVPSFSGRTLMLKSPHMTGEDVKQWQTQMVARGWNHLAATSEFDPPTRDVCVAFQKQKKLPATGRIDAHTWTAAWTAAVTPD
jgi:hypothetical protein